MSYASGTQVDPGRSREEIERILTRYGASSFGYMADYEKGVAQLGFRAHGRMVRFDIPMPDPDDPAFTETDTGRQRKPDAARKAYSDEVRRRWRVLSLVVKAKLEAVASNVTSFEEEFLAHIVLPDGSTVGEFMLPQVERAYETAAMPAMLALPEASS